MTEAKPKDPTLEKDPRFYQWPGRIVFISNIPFKLKAQDVMLICKQFGRCFRVDLEKNALGQSKGIAFVEFETREAANICVEQLDSASLRANFLRAEIANFPPDDLIEVYRKTSRAREEIDKANMQVTNKNSDDKETRDQSRNSPYNEYSDDDYNDKRDRKRDYSDYSPYYSDYSPYYSDYSDYSYSYSGYSDYSDYSSYSYSDTDELEHKIKSRKDKTKEEK